MAVLSSHIYRISSFQFLIFSILTPCAVHHSISWSWRLDYWTHDHMWVLHRLVIGKAACIVAVPSWLELFQPFLSLSLCCAVSNTCLFLFLLIFVHLGILLVFYFCAMSFRNRKYESGFIFEQCLLFFKL